MLKKNIVNNLVGTWSIDPRDTQSIEIYGDTELEFKKGGTLIYTIHEEDKDQIMFLTYKVIRDILITDQPSMPRIEKTPFKFVDDQLVLIYDKHEARYIRKNEETKEK